MRRTHLLLVGLASLCLAAMCVGTAGAAASQPTGPLRLTFVGDSVAASLGYVPAAQDMLEQRGLRARLDLRVCRRLVQTGCPYHGTTPSTALQAVQGYGHSLGSVLVVKVGYNEGSAGYRDGIDRVMRAALAEGARGVVWVTLRETSPIYRATNVEIRAAAAKWPQLVLADWNAWSAGKPWFGRDGLHLNATGASALAAFLRPYVFRAASSHA